MKYIVIIFFGLVLCFHAAAQVDTDRDGLSDALEQKLLETFRPTFMISMSDCAGMPASFVSGQAAPDVDAEDGTIYGQVFPSALGKNLVEIHYYTLWSKDCGQMGHPFDVEHASVLVHIGASGPRARYWYAGAHEGTVCDISSGAVAKAVHAELHGPTIWISTGKHALYLRREMCGGGCGADSCSDDAKLHANGAVINVGELKAPANGSDWVNSSTWVLPEKMDSDFTPAMIAQLDQAPENSVITLKGSRTVRGTIQGSDAVLGGVATGADHTGNALETAKHHTSSGLGSASRATGRFLKRAWNKLFKSPQPKPK